MNGPRQDGLHDELPLACALGPDDGLVRLRRWQRLHELARPTARSALCGLEVRYQPGPGVLAELTDLVAAERVCCSFASWEVFEIDGAPVLRVTAPADTPEAVEPLAAMFATFSAPTSPR